MSSESVSTKLDRIAKLAKQLPGATLTTLAQHIDIEWLREAYQRTRKDGAPGVDGQTAEEYASNLEENLRSLLDRAKAGDPYRAPPVRRVHIPKGDGSKTRPIGIPTFEDKVLQRAVAMVLEAVYEQDFLDCSYGFRPGRSAHQALYALRDVMMGMHGGWVLEADIEGFFDSVDRAKLQQVLRQRVRDGVLVRLVGKWLNAGVMEEGRIRYPGLRHATGRSHLAALGEHLPPRGPGRVVRARGETAAARPGSPRAICGRLRHSVLARGRCAPGVRRTTEAIRQIRLAPSPGENSTRSIRPAFDPLE